MKINNPVLDLSTKYFVRDPAVLYHGGTYYCYITLVQHSKERIQLNLGLTKSRDLMTWTEPTMLCDSPLNFSSPGNVFRFKDKWYLCVQSYPINKGELWGNDSSRLWLMESSDLETWTEPRCIKHDGCTAKWANSARQIDPFIIENKGVFYCYYKTDGMIGVMTSRDLESWTDCNEPAINPDCIGATVENPCIIKHGNEFIMFFTLCKKCRGMCSAKSNDLLNWSEITELEFEDEFYIWAPNGPSAGMVVEKNSDEWLMFLHGEKNEQHSSAMAVLKSTDLVNWTSK